VESHISQQGHRIESAQEGKGTLNIELLKTPIESAQHESHHPHPRARTARVRLHQAQTGNVQKRYYMFDSDKLIEIDRQNEILLNKMQIIKSANYPQNKLRPEAQHLKSLNHHYMNQQF
jgi:hypothetical protein